MRRAGQEKSLTYFTGSPGGTDENSLEGAGPNPEGTGKGDCSKAGRVTRMDRGLTVEAVPQGEVYPKQF